MFEFESGGVTVFRTHGVMNTSIYVAFESASGVMLCSEAGSSVEAWVFAVQLLVRRNVEVASGAHSAISEGAL